jgi:hypothetical protein
MLKMFCVMRNQCVAVPYTKRRLKKVVIRYGTGGLNAFGINICRDEPVF